MKINVFSQPFEHVIIEDYFEENELKDIFNELEAIFLFKEKSNKFINWNLSAKNNGVFTNRIAFDTRNFSKNKESITFKHFEKIFNPDISSYLFKHSNFCNFLRCVTETGVVVGVYQDGDSYKPHYDLGLITAVAHIWHPDFRFEGGELYFPDFDNFSIAPSLNNLIIFPSYLKHGVKKIKNLVKNKSLLYNRISLTMLTACMQGPEANRNLKIKHDY